MADVQIFATLIGGIFVTILATNIIGDYFFNKRFMEELEEFYQDMDDSIPRGVLQPEELEELPLCIQKWLYTSRLVGEEKVTCVRLVQTGQMRMKKKGTWIPFDAEQYFRIDEPGFIWRARMKVTPMVGVMARDLYKNGQGNMLVKLLSVFKLTDATGKEMDQGTLMRYMAEMMWFPSAALSKHIKWEEIDENSARATMTYKGSSGSAVFTFNDKGWVREFVGERYMEKKGRYSLETWAGSVTEYRNMNGIRIPYKGEVTWKLKDGDFTWMKWEICHIEYNCPTPY